MFERGEDLALKAAFPIQQSDQPTDLLYPRREIGHPV